MATIKVLLILGHPRAQSLCGVLADAYQAGALQAGVEVRRLDLAGLDFDPDVHTVSPRDQALEPDLARALESLRWADHLVLVFPGWWGTGPARLKGFLDRILLPDIAFTEDARGRFQPLFTGKTAHLLITLDMPAWVYRLIYRQPGIQAMARSTLGFCGLRTTRVRLFGPVKDSSPGQRAGWLEKARALGFSLHHGPLSPAGRVAARLGSWLRALRLQFYPMTWIAYTVGALGAVGGGALDWSRYGLGYLFLFFLEVATVLGNDWFDYPSDRVNRHAGTFTGGSRVLVEQHLGWGELRTGIALSLALALGALGMLLDYSPLSNTGVLVLAGLLGALALGYTAPPLKLSWRGLGELDVALTHSIGVMLWGFVLQGGAWNDPLPWLLSLPLGLAVLPAILLAGIPDREADRQAGKRTLAVRLGARGVAGLALGLTLAAALAAVWLEGLAASRGALTGIATLVLPHAALLVWLLHDYRRRSPDPGRIDRLLVAALSYILWFGVVPLYRLG